VRQRPVTTGSVLSTDLSTANKYVRGTASGAAGNGLGTTVKYLRRTRNGAATNGLGTTIKYLRQATAAGNRLAATIQ
jgi:putative effector of murein hydrolase